MVPAMGVEVVQGDITRIETDAIVNAANAELVMGGGVCGAIFRAAGIDVLTEACRKIGGCETGNAVTTPAFGIETARVIVHAVGPAYHRHSPADARQLLASAYENAIERAAAEGCRSIAFPAISTGIYGYPLQEACRVAVAACKAGHRTHGIDVKLVAFDKDTAAALRDALGATE